MVPRSKLSPIERLLSRIEVQPNGCWLYRGSLTDGYGQMWDGKRKVLTHRFSYEYFKGPIPSEVITDHLCHKPTECGGGSTCPHRACANPDHIEPSTHAKNSSKGRSIRNSSQAMEPAWKAAAARNRAKTHCVQGHEYTEENTYWWKGGRSCLICRRGRALRVARAKSLARKFIASAARSSR